MLRKITSHIAASFLAIGAFAATALPQAPGQNPGPETPVGRGAFANFSKPLYDLEDGYLKWPLPPSLQKYGTIDGKRLNQYLTQFMDFAYRYRDEGHQWWGRIQGTSAD